MMEYKGYLGKVEFDDDAAIFHGEVVNTRDVLTFHGRSVTELKKAFRASVDDYLDFCAKRGEDPEKPYSGQFVARISPELHRQVSLAASLAGKSLNVWVSEQLQTAVANRKSIGPRSSSTKTRPEKKAKAISGRRKG